MSLNRILLVTSKRLGDTLFFTPAIEQLHKQRPNCLIDVVALAPLSAEVFQFNPAINQIYLASEHPLAQCYSDYDHVICLPNQHIIREYVGSHAVTVINYQPHVRWSHSIAQCLAQTLNYPYQAPGPYLLYPQDSHYSTVGHLLNEANIDVTDMPLIGIHMGSSISSDRGHSYLKRFIPGKLSGIKGWPVACYEMLIEHLHLQYPKAKFILTGTVSELALASRLKGKKHIVNLMGKMSVLELAALMDYFHLYLTGDTGSLHIACAMNTPLVSLFGGTPFELFGPYPSAAHRVVVKAATIKDISVSEVERQIMGLILTTRPKQAVSA